jgi:hypothetical protein
MIAFPAAGLTTLALASFAAAATILFNSAGSLAAAASPSINSSAFVAFCTCSVFAIAEMVDVWVAGFAAADSLRNPRNPRAELTALPAV